MKGRQIRIYGFDRDSISDGVISSEESENRIVTLPDCFFVQAYECYTRTNLSDGDFISEIIKVVLPKDEEEAKKEFMEGLKLGDDTYKGWIATTGGMKVESKQGKCETIFVREDIYEFTKEFENLISLGKFEQIEKNGKEVCINKDILSRISLGLTAAQPVGDMPDIIVLPQAKFHLKKDYKTVKKDKVEETDEEGNITSKIVYNLEDCPVDEDIDVFDGGGIATPDVFNQIMKGLGLNYPIEFAIIRGYGIGIKGMITKFDIVGYLDEFYKENNEFCKKEDGKYYLKDYWNRWRKVTKFTMLLNESMVREYLDGKGYTTIARGLTRDRIPTAAGKDKWWDSTVSGILLNEKYMGTLLLQKTVTVDYLTHKRVDNKNMEPQYKVENNHEPIISPEMWDMVQKERERRFAISAGKNTDRTKYTATYGFSGKLICGQCGNTLKRRHWNSGTPSESIVWQCKSYIDHDGNRCPSKAVKDVELKEAFIRLYNDMVRDKGFFFRGFYNNVEKVIGKNSVTTDIDKLTADINTFENDLSELIQLKIRHQIDDTFYNKEYQRIRGELDTLSEKKESLREENLNQNKMQEKLDYIKKTIGGNTEPLQEFDDELFKTLVEKVMIKDTKHVVFIFEDGLEFEVVLEKVKK